MVIRPNFLLAAVLTAASTLSSGVAIAAPTQLLVNGGFETGTLAGWATSGQGTTGGCPSDGRNWNVSNSGGATGCLFAGNPLSGSYAAYVMNDSGVANNTYTLSQNFFVPTGLTSAILSWADSSVSGYSGASRVFSVDLLEGAALLANVFTYSVPFNDGNATWDARSFDVSSVLAAHAGSTLTLRFSDFVPQVWTGAAGIGVDRVSLAATVPEPGTFALFGLGITGALFARRRGKGTNSHSQGELVPHA